MFDQLSRLEDHLMGMNRQLLAQNNALVKKLLLDDRKKQGKSDTEKENNSRLDGYDGTM